MFRPLLPAAQEVGSTQREAESSAGDPGHGE